MESLSQFSALPVAINQHYQLMSGLSRRTSENNYPVLSTTIMSLWVYKARHLHTHENPTQMPSNRNGTWSCQKWDIESTMWFPELPKLWPNRFVGQPATGEHFGMGLLIYGNLCRRLTNGASCCEKFTWPAFLGFKASSNTWATLTFVFRFLVKVM